MTIDKAIDRIRKLLRTAEGSPSEAEAALAATRAAELMAEYDLSEAQVRLSEDRPAEPIEQEHILVDPNDAGRIRKRAEAWKGTVASAVAKSFGARMYWFGSRICFFGRTSAVQASTYTSLYLFRELERLKAEAIKANNIKNKKTWGHAFLIGAACSVAQRLNERTKERLAARPKPAATPKVMDNTPAAPAVPGPVDPPATATDQALVLVQKEAQEVEDEYAAYSKGWRSRGGGGSFSNYSGYNVGSAAGKTVALGGGRAGIGASKGRLEA